MQKIEQYDLMEFFLSDNAKFVGKYGFPQLKPQDNEPCGDVLPFNYLLSCKNRAKTWFHCFIHDYQFERLWRYFWLYIPFLLEAAGFITTDFSLYRDYELDVLVRNCRKNRVLAYACELNSITYIPTAGFGAENTWDWCFDGLPKYSTVAITTNGVLNDREAKRLFVGGVAALIDTLHPKCIVVCGKMPEWLNKRYTNVKFVSIQSYSQIWKMRRAS